VKDRRTLAVLSQGRTLPPQFMLQASGFCRMFTDSFPRSNGIVTLTPQSHVEGWFPQQCADFWTPIAPGEHIKALALRGWLIPTLPDRHQQRAFRLHGLRNHPIHRRFRRVHIHEYLLSDEQLNGDQWRRVPSREPARRLPVDGRSMHAAIEAWDTDDSAASYGSTRASPLQN
jgi:hypothetical protein